MTIAEQIKSSNPFFQEVGSKLWHNGDVIRVTAGEAAVTFRLPPLVAANNYRLPGWFFAGIWDYLGLRDVRAAPDEQQLLGWGFVQGPLLWKKNLPGEENKSLVYYRHDKMLILKHSETRYETVGRFVHKSIFHAQQQLEEKGWLGREDSPLESLNINDFIV